MLNRYRLLTTFVFLTCIFADSGRSAEPAFTLNIKLASDTAKVGADVTLEVILTNVSDQPQILGWGQPDEGNFTVDVRESSGSQAGKTRYYRDLTGDRTGKDAPEPPLAAGTTTVMVGKFVMTSIPPGKTLTYKAAVNKLYDLSQPGKYTIWVTKLVDENGTIIKSNVVTLTVTDGHNAR